MRMARTVQSALAVVLFGAGPALAADVNETPPEFESPMVEAVPNWYVATRLGMSFPEDTEFGVLGTTVTNEYDSVGFVGTVAVGTQFNLGNFTPRGELEIGYMTSGIDAHDVAGIGTFSGDSAFGDTNVFFGLANAYLDFGNGPLKPFIGAGLGFGHVEFDNHGITAVGTALDDSATGFAWQVGGGVSYAFTSRLAAEVGYRYFSVENVGLTAVDGTESDVDVRSHQVLFGLRYAF